MNLSDPINHMGWTHRDTLKPNDYNPNRVAPPELELLAISILEDGWTQPIVALPDGTIVDGYHRYLVSADPRLIKKYGGMVPVVHVTLDPIHRKMSTIRHNRARGTHAILSMAKIVREMLEEGVTPESIQRRLGMEDEEIDRLASRAGMPVQVEGEFGKAWKPGPG